MFKTLGLISAVVMPFFNIPLIIRIVKRRSSGDISLAWVIGVWVCAIGMLPSSLLSSDPVLRTFAIVNTVFFSGVLVVVIYFHPAIRKNNHLVSRSQSSKES